jgi:hypothetical protein
MIGFHPFMLEIHQGRRQIKSIEVHADSCEQAPAVFR